MTSAKEDQARLLAEHKDALALEAAAMRRGIDAKDVKVALHHALAMLEELRTSSLTPKVRGRRRRGRAGVRAPGRGWRAGGRSPFFGAALLDSPARGAFFLRQP